MVGDQLRIRVRTETAEARRLLSRRAEQLRAALATHGMHVDRFDVTADFLSKERADAGREERSGSPASSWGHGRQGKMEASKSRACDNPLSHDVALLTEQWHQADIEPATAAVKEARLDIRV
jgi:flagellar hook-length control protein FliK